MLFDLQIFSGGAYSPSATSRTISFSISNSFWYEFYNVTGLVKQAGDSEHFSFQERNKKLMKAWEIEGMGCSSFWSWVIGSGALVVAGTKSKDKVRFGVQRH